MKLEIVGEEVKDSDNVEWTATINYKKDFTGTIGNKTYISKVHDSDTKKISSKTGEIDFPKGIIGGDVEITLKVAGKNRVFYLEGEDDELDKFTFKIRGKNPDSSEVSSAITSYSGVLPLNIVKGLFKHESAGGQFTGGEPKYGAPDGWGIGQIDLSTKDNRGENDGHTAGPNYLYSFTSKTIDPEIRWSWKANINEAKRKLRVEKEALAQSWWDRFKGVYPSGVKEPDLDDSDHSYLKTQTGFTKIKKGKQILAVQAYNGVTKDYKFYFTDDDFMWTCWKWDVDDQGNGKWIFYPNQNGYVKEVDEEVK